MQWESRHTKWELQKLWQAWDSDLLAKLEAGRKACWFLFSLNPTQTILIVWRKQLGRLPKFYLLVGAVVPSKSFFHLEALHSTYRAEWHSCSWLCLSWALPPLSFDHGYSKVTCNSLIFRFDFCLPSGLSYKSQFDSNLEHGFVDHLLSPHYLG